MAWVDIPSPILVMLVLFGILGLGVLLVLYGTLMRNAWGINLDPMSCPRCGTPLPRVRKPLTVHQALWGGWTCPACGAEVDKWGRELASTPRRGRGGGSSPMRLPSRSWLVGLTAGGYFALTLLSDWAGLIGGGFPSTWYGLLLQIGSAAVAAAVFAVLFFLAMDYFRKRLLSADGGRGPSSGVGSHGQCHSDRGPSSSGTTHGQSKTD